MGIWAKLTGKQPAEAKEPPYTFEDADRAKSAEVRQAKRDLFVARQELEVEKTRMQIEKLRAEIADIRGEFEDDEPDDAANSPEQMLMGIITAGMASRQPAAMAQPGPMPVQALEMSNEQIKQMIDSFPKNQVQMFAKLPRETKINLITAKVGNIGPDTMNRALAMIDAV